MSRGRFTLLVLCVAVFAASVFGQTHRASIRGIVVDPRDIAGFMGHGSISRKACGNRVVELLALEDRNHLGVGQRVDSMAVRQLVEEDEESTRGRRVV